MKLLATVTAALLAASAANAVTWSAPPGLDPGPLAGQSIVVDFDNSNAAGFSWSGGLTTACSTSNSGAMPAGGGSCFGYVSSTVAPGSATLSTPNLESISFYWGSIDRYNFIDVLGAGGAVLLSISGPSLGSDLPFGNRDAAGSNRRINFIAGAGEVITGLKLTSTGVAFEFDNFAATLAGGGGTTGGAVPEPSSWAMLIAGFGLVGAARRRRRSNEVVTA